MLTMDEYKKQRGITEEDMQAARERGRAYEDAYSLREARKERRMTQVEVADAMGVSQIENGDVDAMTVGSIRRYVEALGGRPSMEMDLPEGRKALE